MVAKYRVLQPAFIQPHFLKPGMIIETESPPADHLEPLNEEAEEAMEAYYKKEVKVLDPDTGEVKRIFHPNEGKRPSVKNSLTPATVNLVAVEEFQEAPIVGVTQERVLANETAGELKVKPPEPKTLKVDEAFDETDPNPPKPAAGPAPIKKG